MKLRGEDVIRIDGKGKGNSRRNGVVRMPSESGRGEAENEWMTEKDRAKYGLPSAPIRIQEETPRKEPESMTTNNSRRLSGAEKDALWADLLSGQFTHAELSVKYSVVPSVISYHAAKIKAECEPLESATGVADGAEALREQPIETLQALSNAPEEEEEEEEESGDADLYGLRESATGMPVDLWTLKEDLEEELEAARQRLAAINLIMAWQGAREAEWAQERETSNDW